MANEIKLILPRLIPLRKDDLPPDQNTEKGRSEDNPVTRGSSSKNEILTFKHDSLNRLEKRLKSAAKGRLKSEVIRNLAEYMSQNSGSCNF